MIHLADLCNRHSIDLLWTRNILLEHASLGLLCKCAHFNDGFGINEGAQSLSVAIEWATRSGKSQ